jgi:DeoR/GlpR family transcriptional regulator of sugar metabolism
MLEAGPGGFEGGMTPKKLQSIASVAGATATRDLVELVEKGLMVRRAAGRSTRYELALEGWEWKPIAPRSNSSTKTDSV